MNADPPHPQVDPSEEPRRSGLAGEVAAGVEGTRPNPSNPLAQSTHTELTRVPGPTGDTPSNTDDTSTDHISRFSLARLFWSQLKLWFAHFRRTGHESKATESPSIDLAEPAANTVTQTPPEVAPDDQFTGARAFLRPSPWAITGPDCLKFESFANEVIRGNYWNFLWWCLGEIILCLSVFSYVEHENFLIIAKGYLGILAIGSVAANGNLFFLLFISERIRNLRPFVEKITGNTLAVAELYQSILYDHYVVYSTTGACLALGYFTFHELGIAGPVPIAKGITMGLFVVFGTLGLVIGFVFNVWRFFFRLGPLIRNIDISHPDRMGGLEPIGDANLWLLYIGATLIAVYTVGAKYSPYAQTASKEYAYLWTVMAVSLWIIAVFVPTLTIHQVLRSAKLEQQNHLAQLKDRLFTGFKSKISEMKPAVLDLDHIETYASSIKSAVDALRYFECDLDLMTTWPYRNAAKTLVNLISIQALTNVVIHWNDIVKVLGSFHNPSTPGP